MISTTRKLAKTTALGVLLAVAGCDRADPSAGSTGGGTTAGTAAGASSGAAAGSGASDTGDPASGTTAAGSQCDGPDIALVAAMCEAATDEAGCAAAREALPCGICNWDVWVPATIDGQGVCSFGEPSGRCVFEYSPDGCSEAFNACRPGQAMYREKDGVVELLVSPTRCVYTGTGPCGVEADGTVTEGSAPECACICDESYPG